MMTKTEITEHLNEFRKLGCIVKTFNSQHKMSRGAVGFVDHVIVSGRKGLLIFIEVKLGRDKLKSAQQDLQEALQSVVSQNQANSEHPNILYYQITDKNFGEVYNQMRGYLA